MTKQTASAKDALGLITKGFRLPSDIVKIDEARFYYLQDCLKTDQTIVFSTTILLHTHISMLSNCMGNMPAQKWNSLTLNQICSYSI
jgi:hypothetical protein